MSPVIQRYLLRTEAALQIHHSLLAGMRFFCCMCTSTRTVHRKKIKIKKKKRERETTLPGAQKALQPHCSRMTPHTHASPPSSSALSADMRFCMCHHKESVSAECVSAHPPPPPRTRAFRRHTAVSAHTPKIPLCTDILIQRFTTLRFHT